MRIGMYFLKNLLTKVFSKNNFSIEIIRNRMVRSRDGDVSIWIGKNFQKIILWRSDRAKSKKFSRPILGGGCWPLNCLVHPRYRAKADTLPVISGTRQQCNLGSLSASGSRRSSGIRDLSLGLERSLENITVPCYVARIRIVSETLSSFLSRLIKPICFNRPNFFFQVCKIGFNRAGIFLSSSNLFRSAEFFSILQNLIHLGFMEIFLFTSAYSSEYFLRLIYTEYLQKIH